MSVEASFSLAAAPNDPPTLRSGHTATKLGGELILFGGSIERSCTAEAVALDLTGKE